MSSLNNIMFNISHNIHKCTLFSKTCIPKLSYSRSIVTLPTTYSNWQISKYGDVSELKLTENDTLPILQNKNQVLIKVHAASVNQIDVKMLGIY